MSERRVSKRLKAKALEAPGSNGHGHGRLSEEEASEFEDEPVIKSPKKAKAKSRSSVSSGRAKRKGKLSMLPDMPLDILFQIFSHLDPKDLISITRTNRLCRNTLLAPNAVGIWRAVRRRCDAPDPLQDFSEPRWAKLIFGGAICEICGRTGVKDPDFILRRRACRSCFSERLVNDWDEDLLYDYRSVLKLVPCKISFEYKGRRGQDVRRWWSSDLEKVSLQYRGLEKAVRDGGVDAEQNLEAYKQERLELVRAVKEQAEKCNIWLENYRQALEDEKRGIQLIRLEAIKQRFLDLGYDGADIRSALQRPEAENGGLLTDRIWTRIRPKLEPFIQEARDERLFKQKVEAMSSVVDSLYKAYLKSAVPPKQWRFQPCASEVCHFPEFLAALEATNGDITEQTFASLIPELHSIIQSWQATRRAKVLERMSYPDPKLNCPCPICTNLNDSSLKLAVAVFMCGDWVCHQLHDYDHRGLFFYYDGHHCRGRDHCGAKDHNPVFSWSGHHIAAAVIHKAGLDPSNATIGDMDQRGALFLADRDSTDKVYNWRQMVQYLHYYRTPTSSVKVLLDEEMASVVYEEDASLDESWWTCTHCAVHCFDWKTHEEAIEHVKQVHGITSPVTNEDVILGFDKYPCNPYVGSLP